MSLSVSPSLSRSQSSFLPPPVFSLFHIKLLFIAQHPSMVYFFSFAFCVCTNLGAPPSVCVSPPASPHLSALRGFSREHPHPTPPTPLPFSLLHALLQGTGRGTTKRLNILDCTLPEERQWFDVPCVVSDRIVLFVWPVCVFFTSSTLNSDR